MKNETLLLLGLGAFAFFLSQKKDSTPVNSVNTNAQLDAINNALSGAGQFTIVHNPPTPTPPVAPSVSPTSVLNPIPDWQKKGYVRDPASYKTAVNNVYQPAGTQSAQSATAVARAQSVLNPQTPGMAHPYA